MSSSNEIVGVNQAPVSNRFSNSLLSPNLNAEELAPVIDMRKLKKSSPWYQKVMYYAGPVNVMAPIMTLSVATSCFITGSLLSALGASALFISGTLISALGGVKDSQQHKWAKRVSEAHVRSWLKEQWGLEVRENQFDSNDLTNFVNSDFPGKYEFVAIDGKVYQLSRVLRGATVTLTDVHNREVKRTRAALVAAVVKVPVKQFDVEGQQVAKCMQELMVQLSKAKLGPEQQYVVERAGKILAEAAELAERIDGLDGEARRQVDGQLTLTLRAALEDLEHVSSENLEAAVSDVAILAAYTQAVSLKKPSRLTLPPES